MTKKLNNKSLSKALSWALRHGIVDLNLNIDKEGYVSVTELLSKKDFKMTTIDSILEVVETNEKQRFSLITKDEILYIRANQGHSQVVGNLIDITQSCVKIKEPLGKCIHGTTSKAWEIIKIEGLNKMERTHIHFAIAEPSSDLVISGARSTSKVLIYLNMLFAMEDGIEFYMSENNVILSNGIDGIIHPKYFEKIVFI